MKGLCGQGQGHAAMGGGGGLGVRAGSQLATGVSTTGHVSQTSLDVACLGWVRGGGPSGGGGATERVRASMRPRKARFSSSALTMT
jgi:hypothetical protein